MDERCRFVTSSEDEFHAVDMQSSSSHRKSSIKCDLSMCNVVLCTFVLRLQQQHLVGTSNSTHATYNIWQSFKCMKGILNCWSTSPIIVMYNDNIANQRVSVMWSLARATWMIAHWFTVMCHDTSMPSKIRNSIVSHISAKTFYWKNPKTNFLLWRYAIFLWYFTIISTNIE